MTAAKLSPQELQKIRDLAAAWGKIVARRAYGDAGPGLGASLFALEQVADAAAHGVAQGTLAALLEHQAQALPTEQACPQCGHRCPVEREPRSLVGHGGSLTYPEPVGHCPACRRDFFPSAGRLAAE